MLVLSMLACGAAQAGPTADVMLVSGDVKIHRGDTVLTPATDTDLFEDDRIETGSDGSVIVVLKNRHVIRLDGDLQLAVKDIAMLGAPESTQAPKAQLAMLLFPAEFDAASIAHAERVAGWDMRRGANRSEGKSHDMAAPDAPGTATPSAAPPPPRRPAPISGENAKSKPMGGGGSVSKKEAAEMADDEVMEDRTDEMLLRGDRDFDAAPDFAGALSASRATCLVEWKAAQSIDASTLAVRVFFADNRVLRVTSREGYALPACLSVQDLARNPVKAWHTEHADIDLVLP